MDLKPGWLQRQFTNVSEDVKRWPAWMRREAGFAGGGREPMTVEEARNWSERVNAAITPSLDGCLRRFWCN